MWHDYHVCLIATLLDEIYHLIELPSEWLIDDAMFVYLLGESILGFCYSDLTLETGGFELASTITLVLQPNRLTKCSSVWHSPIRNKLVGWRGGGNFTPPLEKIQGANRVNDNTIDNENRSSILTVDFFAFIRYTFNRNPSPKISFFGSVWWKHAVSSKCAFW